VTEPTTPEPGDPELQRAPMSGGIDVTLIRRIERTALIIGVVAVAASVASNDLRFIAGTFIGATIGWLNLQTVRVLVDRAVRLPEQRKAVMAAFTAKFLVLLTVITIVVLLADVNLIGFLVGISSTVVAATLVPLLNPLFPGNTPPTATPAEGEAAPPREEGQAPPFAD
jgi:hypothetical protein